MSLGCQKTSSHTVQKIRTAYKQVVKEIVVFAGIYDKSVIRVANLLRGAYKDFYDTAILISSDTDLIPAIQYLREEGKKLEYIGFSFRPSYGLIKYSDIRTLLKKEDIEQFQPK